MFFFYPFRQRFEFDPDEGSHAMQALLLLRGYRLYTQIWFDHPPGFIYLLAGAFRVFGLHPDVGRSLVLFFSALLLWAVWRFLRLTWGVPHALAGVALLFLLPYYLSLSVSIMIGLPAIALAALSMLALTAWHQQHKAGYLVLSAVFLAFSVLTKVFTAFLALIFAFGIVLGERSGARTSLSARSVLKPLMLWSGVLTGVTAGLALALMGVKDLSPLITTHLLVWRSPLYTTNPALQSITLQMRDAWPILILGLAGAALAVRARRWLSLYPLAWAGVAYGLLSFQVPVWYHHQLLITVPGAMLAGIGVGESLRQMVRQWSQRAFSPLVPIYILLGASFILISTARARQVYLDFVLPAYQIEPAAPPAGRETELLNEIARYAGRVQWMITDLPMYPLRAGLMVPPPLGNISEKRLASGQLNEAQIIAFVQAYKPGLILIGRYKFPALEHAIRTDYKLIYSWGRKHLYLRRDLLRSP